MIERQFSKHTSNKNQGARSLSTSFPRSPPCYPAVVAAPGPPSPSSAPPKPPTMAPGPAGPPAGLCQYHTPGLQGGPAASSPTASHATGQCQLTPLRPPGLQVCPDASAPTASHATGQYQLAPLLPPGLQVRPYASAPTASHATGQGQPAPWRPPGLQAQHQAGGRETVEGSEAPFTGIPRLRVTPHSNGPDSSPRRPCRSPPGPPRRRGRS